VTAGNGTSSLDRPPLRWLHCFIDNVMCFQRCMLNFFKQNSGIPGTPCWTGPRQQSAQASRADQDSSCSDNVCQLVPCSGWQHDDYDALSETLLPLLHLTVDESMDSSPSSTITYDDGLGGEVNNISFTVEQPLTSDRDLDDDATTTLVSGRDRSTPDGIDSNMEELTVSDFSTHTSSMGVELPVVDVEQITSVPWSLLPGFRFLPTDLELVLHWLRHKNLNFELHDHNAVKEGVDVHRTNADEITRK
jgi:hypothetical protein